ncbi:MAG: hypothetical protein OXD40_02910 [bacterium]|nr:hypothetical protein [bacterium]
MLFKRTVRDEIRRDTIRTRRQALSSFASRINVLKLLTPPW